MTKHYVYIVSNANRTLYTGMAFDVVRRVEQHKKGTFPNAFTKRYNFDRPVYLRRATFSIGCSQTREADQRLDVRKESCTDRSNESGLEGLVGRLESDLQV